MWTPRTKINQGKSAAVLSWDKVELWIVFPAQPPTEFSISLSWQLTHDAIASLWVICFMCLFSLWDRYHKQWLQYKFMMCKISRCMNIFNCVCDIPKFQFELLSHVNSMSKVYVISCFMVRLRMVPKTCNDMLNVNWLYWCVQGGGQFED